MLGGTRRKTAKNYIRSMAAAGAALRLKLFWRGAGLWLVHLFIFMCMTTARACRSRPRVCAKLGTCVQPERQSRRQQCRENNAQRRNPPCPPRTYFLVSPLQPIALLSPPRRSTTPTSTQAPATLVVMVNRTGWIDGAGGYGGKDGRAVQFDRVASLLLRSASGTTRTQRYDVRG